MRYVMFKLLAVAFVLTLSGCAVGPDYEKVDTVADDGEFVNASETQSELEYEEIVWWKSFDDPVTDGLVEQALKNNTDLQGAALAVMQSEALLKSSFGRRLPSVDYNGSVSRSRQSEVNYNTNYNAGLSINYVADIFGKLRKTEKAAMAELWASQANREALQHLIIAQTVKSRIRISQFNGLLEVARATTKSWAKTLKTIERRYEQGLLKAEDLHLARENYAANQALIPGLEQGLGLAYNSLDVLLGQKPGMSKGIGQLGSLLPDLKEVPVGLPASLLDRRPDLRSAEFRVMAANERIGASMAALYPDLTLSVSGGLKNEELHELLDWESRIYSVISGLAGPIFRGGTLRADVQLKKTQMEQASVGYKGLILKAMQEVEDALIVHEKQLEVLAFVEKRLQEANKAEKLATDRYLNGASGSFLRVLESQRRRQIAENQLVLTRNEIWTNRVDLYLALGGDWTEEGTRQ